LSDDLAARLAAIQDALLALPADAFAQKHELLKERDVLRGAAADFAGELDAQRSDDDLLAELKALRAQLHELEKTRIDPVGQSGGGAGGASVGMGMDAVAMNQQMMDAGGARSLQARIGVLKGLLADRDVEVPEG